MPSQQTQPATSTEPTLALPARPPEPDPASKKAERVDIYDRVTTQIVAILEEGGVLPWQKPWHAEHLAGRISRPLRHTGEPYQGINVLSLWLSSVMSGYTSPLWVTFKQALELGGNVRKGEHGSKVVYAGSFDKQEAEDAPKADGQGDKKAQKVFFLREYTVFNSEQCDNLPERFTKMQPVPGQAAPVEPVQACEEFFGNLGATVEHGGNMAAYVISQDVIKLPARVTFRDAEGYYATFAHEAVHWSSPPERANRVIDDRRFGSASYAFEELVAELGSAFLCADLGIAPVTPRENAGYIATWLKVLKDDKRAIFTAAALAQKAVDWCHGRQPCHAAD